MTTKRKRAQKNKQRQRTVMFAAIGIFVFAIIWIITSGWATPAAGGPLPLEINTQEAYQNYKEGAFVLDVRTPEEWADYHAPDTTLIPLDELELRVNEVPRDQDIVVICRSGNRSQVGRDILLAAGFTDVTSVTGGLNGWKDAGYPTVSGP